MSYRPSFHFFCRTARPTQALPATHAGRFVTLSGALWLLVLSCSLAPFLPRVVAQEDIVIEPEAPGWNGLRPRPLFQEPDLTSIEPGFATDVWVLKFHEGTRVRLRGDVFVKDDDPRDSEDERRMDRVKLDAQAVAAGLLAVNGWLQQFGVRAEPHFERPEAELEAWRLSGEKRSGRELADLNLYYTCKVDPGIDEDRVLAALRAVRAIAVVETAFPLPLPQDASITANLTTQQNYRNRSARGIDDVYVENHPGANGAGVRIVDVEAGWNTGHCDLPGLFFNRGVSWPPGDHGTAVLGIMAGLNDGVGVTGICHAASFGVSSVSNVNGPYALGSAIDSAAAAVGFGDIVLIEQHLQGPNPGTTCNCNCDQFRYIPVEYWPVYFDAIANATANGVIVVEAGGNGSMNLDDPVYGGRFDRTVRDSGAIIVGAKGSRSTSGPSCWTNFGTRVDVCAWGQNVVTTGYGDHGSSGPTNDDFYTATFSGTSSASPIVVGAVAEIQGYLRARGRASLDPWTMRELLVQTGTAHVPDARHIGPMPNIRHALHELVRMSAASGDFNGDGIVDLAIGNPWAEVNGRSGAGKVSICLSSRDHSSARVSYEISQGSTTVDLADAPEENDWFGFALAAGDFNGDGIDDLAIGAPGEDFSRLSGGGIENEGRVHVVYGSATGVGLGVLPECVLRQSALGGGSAINVDLPGVSETGDLLGYSLACGDVNGDGFDDLTIGAPGESYGAVPRTGTVQLIFGSSAPFSNADPSTGRFSSVAADNLLSRSVHVSDLDADGFAELIVGTPGFDTPTTQDVGRVLVYMANSGGIPGTPLVIGPGDLLAKTTDDENGDGSITMTDLVLARMGESLTSGRTGGGTRNYLYLGAPGFGDSNRIGSGAVLEVLDPENPFMGKLLQQDTSSAFSNLPGTAGRFDLTGKALACGDFNGDGFDDLAIGAPGEGVVVDSGAVRVVKGIPILGVSTSTGTASFSEASWPTGTPDFAELFGATVLSLDHNGDGFQDLLVLEPGEGTSASAPDLSLRFLYGGPPGLQPSTGEWCEVGETIDTRIGVTGTIRDIDSVDLSPCGETCFYVRVSSEEAVKGFQVGLAWGEPDVDRVTITKPGAGMEIVEVKPGPDVPDNLSFFDVAVEKAAVGLEAGEAVIALALDAATEIPASTDLRVLEVCVRPRGEATVGSAVRLCVVDNLGAPAKNTTLSVSRADAVVSVPPAKECVDLVVRDTTPPVVSCPDDIVVPCSDQDSPVVNYAANAVDDCGKVEIKYFPPSGSVFPPGVTTVTCEATDTSGNVTVCSFEVNVGTGGCFKRSDVNADGAVDITDGISGLKYLFQGGAAPTCLDTLDSNDDGKNDITDPLDIFNYLFRGGDAPPAPGPLVCGSDPTEDNLGECEYPVTSCE